MSTDFPQSSALTLQQAVAHHRAGQLQDAERLYRVILQTQSNHPDANHNLGVLAVQMKQPAAGLPHFRTALATSPTQGQYWLSYIDALIQAGQPDIARQVLEQGRQQGLQGEGVDALTGKIEEACGGEPGPQEAHALLAAFNEERYTEAATLAQKMTTQFPHYGFGWKVLGAALQQLGKLDEALAAKQKAVTAAPEDADAHNNLGNALQEQGRLAEAEASLRQALKIQPGHAAALNNLGLTLQKQGRHAEAETSLRSALGIQPDYAEAYFNLGNTLYEQGRFTEAETCYRLALQIMPAYAEAHCNLGATLNDLDRLPEAEASLRQALKINPNYAEAHYNLGRSLQQQCRYLEAESSYRQALAKRPDLSKAHNNLGNVLTHQGRFAEAELSYRRAMEIDQDYAEAHSNLIFMQDMSDGIAVNAMQQERRRWSERHATPLLSRQAHPNHPDPERRLRIGYVSADLRNHSAAKVFGTMLTRFDSSRFKVFAYSNSRKVDNYTQWFQQHVTRWRNIVGVSDEAVAAQIRQDEIDILVDLSGHSAGNRLLVFARKPAPIQITAWGYIGGTGMEAMDVFFADPVVVPPEDQALYSEQIRYLPNVVNYSYQPPLPAVNALPALTEKRLTFGSFNRLVKISDETYRNWAQILQAFPDSRLILKTVGLDDPSTRERVTNHFTQAGISAERLILLGGSSWHEHMEAFNRVDISLDPFPHGGGVTTLEGLMMGVPVITLRCPTLVGRLSASILTTLDLPDWIAESPEEYIEIAKRKAQDIAGLADLRQQLRGRVNSSIIGDTAAYARAVELEYRQLWREWCERQPGWQKNAISTLAGTEPDPQKRQCLPCKELPPILPAIPHLQGNAITKFNKPVKSARKSGLHKGKNPSLQEINKLITLFNERRYTESATLAQTMTQHFPQHGLGWKILGATLMQLGRSTDALAPMQKAAALSPHDAEAYSNLGITLKKCGRLAEAEASFRQALQIKSNLAEVHNNLGNTLKDMGRLTEAEACYRRALAIKPHFAEAHSNLGSTLKDMDRLDEAEASYRRALEIKPDFAEVLSNLALLFNAQSKSILALHTIQQSLQTKETEEAKNVFTSTLKRLHCTTDDNEMRTTVVRALTEPWGRPIDIAHYGIELVTLNPDIRKCVTRATDSWPLRLSGNELFGENGLAAIATNPLLRALLDAAPICDIELEHFLTMARWAMLDTASAIDASDTESNMELSFHSALARQCFINEYIFSCSAEEIQKANDLCDLLRAALDTGSRLPMAWLVAVAAYFPLYTLPHATRLFERQWPEEVLAVLEQQIREPEEELQLRATIPRLTDFENEVSLQVQNQYEENPYPRWVKMPHSGNPMDINRCLLKTFPLAPIQPLNKHGEIDILIAGCGTGQHSISTAQRFQGARILAIDLSASSLGYAKRKTCELGLTSIEYAQADLLKLASLNRSFDVIESSGVLHHLADPWAGWRVLLSLLRPGGLMNLGFYSEIARRNIVRIREIIAENKYGSSSDEIRRFRQDMVDMDESANFGTTLKSPDFFSVSACRDLLFHVQEHRMTLTGISAFLRENHLTFLGFEIDADILYAYKRRFPEDRAATNLELWHIFENENPSTFSGMYQFWIQKTG